jgi:arylsulfatase A-like enzyme
MLKPNILLIISDHHRFDYMRCAGNNAIHTPCLDWLAAKGTRITGMYCNAPICVPSRIAITTGRYPSNTGCYTNSHPADFSSRTFVQCLAENGYHTGLVGKFHHHTGAGKDFGIANEDDIRRLGFQHIVHCSGKAGVSFRNQCRYAERLQEHDAHTELTEWYGINQFAEGGKPGKMKRPADNWPFAEELKIDNFIAAEAESFLNEQKDSLQPFYLQVGLCGPHPPLDAPSRFTDLYQDVPVQRQVGEGARVEAYWRGMLATITETDEKVGVILDALEKNGLRDNTIVIYTSDHGDMMGDHGRNGKCTFYEGSVHVPYIVSGPGIEKGKEINVLAELLDTGKTICDLADIDSHLLDQGKSLKKALFQENDSHRNDVL